MTEELALFSLEGADEGGVGASDADLQTAHGLLALKSLPKIGDGRAIKLALTFRSEVAFNEASPARRQAVSGAAVESSVHISEAYVPDGARLISYFDDAYPALLRTIPNPPAVIWVRGELPESDKRLAIVGTRSATPWGIQMAESIAAAAVGGGVSVVSGLALGIDIAAHRGAVAHGGRTIAVLGSGIDNVTPREHRTDAETILEAGGCLISEVSPGTQPSPRTLVARNRIQSGLSYATVVVQCGVKSGTMTTAKFALEQGRVLALPVPPTSERAHPENAGSGVLATGTPTARVLDAREDLAELLAEIS